MHKSVLMCRPTFFLDPTSSSSNDKKIYSKNGNTWRTVHNRTINHEKAMDQWNNLVSILRKNNVHVHILEGTEESGNQVFMANAGLVYNNNVLLSVFKNVARKSETEGNNKAFQSLGFNVTKSKHIFEGEGDALFTHNTRNLWLSYGFRSDPKIVSQLQLLAPHSRIITLKLVNPLWYHLDTCFLPLTDNQLLIYAGAFDEESVNKIYNHFPKEKVIEVSDVDSMQFVCNSVLLENKTIITYRMSTHLKHKLAKWGYTIVETDMSEFVVAGGSVKCTVCNLSYGW